MSAPLPEALSEAIARITSPADEPDRPRPHLTGSLGDLDVWWRQRAGEARPVAREIVVEATGSSAVDALLLGLTYADRAIDSGITLLVPRVGERHLLEARGIIGLLTKRDASAVTHQPAGMADVEWMAACAGVRDLMAEQRSSLGDHVALLDAMGTPPIAAVAGMLIGASSRRTPCLLDGTDEWAGALVADRLAHRARHWWTAATTSTDPARMAARERIDVAPGLPLGLTDEDGWGARTVVALLDLIEPGAAETQP